MTNISTLKKQIIVSRIGVNLDIQFYCNLTDYRSNFWEESQ